MMELTFDEAIVVLESGKLSPDARMYAAAVDALKAERERQRTARRAIEKRRDKARRCMQHDVSALYDYVLVFFPFD